MRIDILTIFPGMFNAVLNESIIKRAQLKEKVKIVLHNIRDFSLDKHCKVDDRPFGGGPGMVMHPEPIFRAVEHALACASGNKAAARKRRFSRSRGAKRKIILLSPQGKRLDQKSAKKMAKMKQIILICGHYEGIDERVKRFLVDEEVSIGDYVLTGGELPAMVFVDCIVRLLPGVLGEKKSLHFESFEGNLLEYPQYTRPANYKGMQVPQVLLSGDHNKIQEWRKEESIKITKKRRPDLFRSGEKKVKRG
ncbi:MAG: tRNA (guanosine(37)-N1)-methyltransferase TrmD [Candidatus Omnitrophica bacterium]|nr:tRNA (guanosine(37)-N1)-methyltransferase TrmD [Candidatus Omnitrophota bacterium]